MASSEELVAWSLASSEQLVAWSSSEPSRRRETTALPPDQVSTQKQAFLDLACDVACENAYNEVSLSNRCSDQIAECGPFKE